jgi:hypothetical protein
LRSTSETARVAGRSPKLFFASHQVIVTFVLPKRAVTESEGFLGLVGRESFQGSQPLCQGNELSITVQQRLYNQPRDVRAFQVQRSGSAFIE